MKCYECRVDLGQEVDMREISEGVYECPCCETVHDTREDDIKNKYCPLCYGELTFGSINYDEGYHIDGCDGYGVHYSEF